MSKRERLTEGFVVALVAGLVTIAGGGWVGGFVLLSFVIALTVLRWRATVARLTTERDECQTELARHVEEHKLVSAAHDLVGDALTDLHLIEIGVPVSRTEAEIAAATVASLLDYTVKTVRVVANETDIGGCVKVIRSLDPSDPKCYSLVTVARSYKGVEPTNHDPARLDNYPVFVGLMKPDSRGAYLTPDVQDGSPDDHEGRRSLVVRSIVGYGAEDYPHVTGFLCIFSTKPSVLTERHSLIAQDMANQIRLIQSAHDRVVSTLQDRRDIRGDAK